MVAFAVATAAGTWLWVARIRQFRHEPAAPAAERSPALPLATTSAPPSSPAPAVTAPSSAASTPSPAPSPETAVTVPPQESARAGPSPPEGPAGRLLIPVAGVRPEQLRDTFNEARSEGRVHDAIDIPAPHGTPVLAAADGRIVKLFLSVRGGITIYELDPDNRTIYYYAHLDRYAEGLAEGQFVHRGDVIAYVGDTGDAGPGNYHLHFSISIVSDPKRYWEGTNINPYPLLHGP